MSDFLIETIARVEGIDPAVLAKIEQDAPALAALLSIAKELKPILEEAKPLLAQAMPIWAKAKPLFERAKPLLLEFYQDLQVAEPDLGEILMLLNRARSS